MKYVVLILIALFVIFLLIDVIDCNRFVIRNTGIRSDKLNRNIRLILLTDLHNKAFGKKGRKLSRAVKYLSPDLICMAGDMITARPGVDNKNTYDFLEELTGGDDAVSCPVIFGIGNHEYRMKIYPETYGDSYETLKKFLAERHIEVLENDSSVISDLNVCVQGLMIDRKFYKRFEDVEMEDDYIKNITGAVPDDTRFNILIAHDPEYFDNYVDYGSDLILSGHFHGGLMRLPFGRGFISPRFKLFTKFSGGTFKKKGSTMVLSRGLGSHTLPIRIFNPGELVVIDIVKD
ncbi:MAG: metallophosphoesterase [Lachnospiraceae bacterium]|nr:metallophosphoesterase [Lachnospiraceae bacterium]